MVINPVPVSFNAITLVVKNSVVEPVYEAISIPGAPYGPLLAFGKYCVFNSGSGIKVWSLLLLSKYEKPW